MKIKKLKYIRDEYKNDIEAIEEENEYLKVKLRIIKFKN
jgi:hypothetical protein